MGGDLNARKPTQNISGQFYSQVYVNTRETWTRENQLDAF